MVVLDEQHPLSICQIRICPSSHNCLNLLFEKKSQSWILHAHLTSNHKLRNYILSLQLLNQHGVKIMPLKACHKVLRCNIKTWPTPTSLWCG